MQIATKFVCQSVLKTLDGENVSLTPARSPDNDGWAGSDAAVGNFSITIGATSDALGQFRPGQTYAVIVEG